MPQDFDFHHELFYNDNISSCEGYALLEPWETQKPTNQFWIGKGGLTCALTLALLLFSKPHAPSNTTSGINYKNDVS